jgi:hypothetical protein
MLSFSSCEHQKQYCFQCLLDEIKISSYTKQVSPIYHVTLRKQTLNNHIQQECMLKLKTEIIQIYLMIYAMCPV